MGSEKNPATDNSANFRQGRAQTGCCESYPIKLQPIQRLYYSLLKHPQLQAAGQVFFGSIVCHGMQKMESGVLCSLHPWCCNLKKKISIAFGKDLEIQSTQLTWAILEGGWARKRNTFLSGEVAISGILCRSSCVFLSGASTQAVFLMLLQRMVP